jgi:uncharacterized membrane protein
MIGLALVFCLGAVIALIAVLIKMSETTSRIRILEEKVSYILHEVQGAGKTAETKSPLTTGVQAEPSRAAGTASAQAPPVAPMNVPPPKPTQPSVPPYTPPPAAPSRSRGEWEALIGGKLLNRIGALALVIGIGFFLKYAFDNNWLSESVRVLLGAAAGFLLLAGAARSRKGGLLIFAQGLVGAGIAVLYLSVYASFNYYHLVAQPIAFVLMAIVTIIAFTQAFRYDSIAVSFLGWMGGFLTPFMLSTGEANEIGLFSYIALLAAGMLVVVMKKEKWAILEPLTLAATYFIYFLWYGQEYKADTLTPTLFFATLFWALFFVVDIVHILRHIEILPELRNVASVFNAALFYLALFLLIDHDHHAWMGGTTLALGAIYFLTALAVRRSNPEAKGSFARLTSVAIVLLILAPAIEFKRFTIIISWSLEALALAWCGRRWSLRFVSLSAFALYAVAGWALLATEGALFERAPEAHTVLLNMRTAAFALLAACMGMAGIMHAKAPSASGANRWEMKPGAVALFHFGWSFLLFILFTVETNDLFRYLMIGTSGASLEALSFQRYMTLAAVWAFLGTALLWGGKHRVLAPPAYSGIVIMFLGMGMAAVRGVAFAPVEQFELISNYRVLALLCVIAASFTTVALLARMNGMEWGRESADIIGVFAAILILVLLTGETRDFFERKLLLPVPPGEDGAYSSTALENMKQLCLSGIWLLYSITLMGIGIWRRLQTLRVIAIVLFGVTILKIFIYDLSFLETLYRIFSFIGLGMVLLAVSYLYQHYRDVILQGEPKKKAEDTIV